MKQIALNGRLQFITLPASAWRILGKVRILAKNLNSFLKLEDS